MYKISLPILGFEHISELKIKKIDEYFSTLILENQQSINIVNITFLKDSPFNFNIEEIALAKLHIGQRTDFDIYFCVVIQNPIEQSVVNLTAPILINKKHSLIGQYIIKDKIPKLFASLDSFIPNI